MLLFTKRDVPGRGQRSTVKAAPAFVCDGRGVPDIEHLRISPDRSTR